MVGAGYFEHHVLSGIFYVYVLKIILEYYGDILKYSGHSFVKVPAL